MSFIQSFVSLPFIRVYQAHWLGLILFGMVWGTSAQGAGCDPVIEGAHGNVTLYASVYSSCTATYTGELTISINYNPGGFIYMIADEPSSYTPEASMSRSIGPLVDNKYYTQDMGIGYVGTCTEMTGALWTNPPAIAGHYYCFRFDGAAADLYIGGSLTNTNTFIDGTASIVGTAPVSGTITANNVTQDNAGDTSYSLTIDYSDADGDLDVTSVGNADITVCNGGTCASVASTGWVGTTSSGTATYTLTPPGGSWDAGDSGIYTVAIEANEVADSLLSYVAANASAGSFSVSIAGPTVPDAPTIGTATSANTAASIAFTAPDNNGGSVILDYTASCEAGTDATGPASPLVVTGLTNGTTYNCHVKARNDQGSSLASGSVSVTPEDGGTVVLPPSDSGPGETVTFTYTATQADGVTPVPATLTIAAADPGPPTPPESLVSAVDITSTSTIDGYILVVTFEISAPSINLFTGFWKYGKETSGGINLWYDYGTLAANGDGTGYELSADQKSLTIYLIDGIRGDNDWQINASITDPALPIIQAAQAVFADGFESDN